MNELDTERIEKKLDEMLAILHGDGRGDMGLIQKINILWTIVFKWPLYVLSIVLGSLITLAIQHFGK